MAIIATSTAAMAQSEGFTKGSLFLSGNVGFSSEKNNNNDSKFNSFSFSPRIGYFVTDKVAVGLRAGIESGTDEFEVLGETFEQKTSTTTIGLFGRYYFTPASKFSMFLNLGADYVSSKEEETGEEDFKVNGFDIGLAPGLHYFISNRLALETSIGLLGYSTRKADVDGAEAVNSFGLNLGLNSLTFGLVFKLK